MDTKECAGAIERMLNLNQDAEPTSDSSNGLVVPSGPILKEDGEPIWKILVFDDLV